MTDRLNFIYKEIPNCEIFADIGCDHGYVAKAMLDQNKAERVIVSDISEKCLNKARELLKGYELQGRAKSVVSDGFQKIDNCSVALIAGMGGEEIISIIDKAKSLPETLILQPMKNCDKVRYRAVSLGYKIEKDFVFKAGGKFYDLIVLKKGNDLLTEEEAEFGRTNIKEKSADFIEMLKSQRAKFIEFLKEVPDGERKTQILLQLSKIDKYV